jgi:hypothetical protein
MAVDPSHFFINSIYYPAPPPLPVRGEIGDEFVDVGGFFGEGGAVEDFDIFVGRN